MFTRDLRVLEENIIDVSEYLFQKLEKQKNHYRLATLLE